MQNKLQKIDHLGQKDIAKLILNMSHRIIVHYVLWFTEVTHQLGYDKALEIIDEVSEKSFEIQMKRISNLLGIKLQDNIPEALLDMPRESLIELAKTTAVNWLANDGVWFQGVEFKHGMNDAKRCNDSCWAHFSPFEAWSVKKFLDLPENSGLEGLKKALCFRLYAFINEQSIADEGSDSFVFKMNECRVQSARKRKNLPEYPCKTAGLVEYPYFARAIDSRIKTECIACPPDEHPDEWCCAWRFSIEKD